MHRSLRLGRCRKNLPLSAPSPLKLILFPRDDDAAFLRPREVAERLANSNLSVSVDWDHANAQIQSGLECLEQSGAPSVIVDAHRQQFDNCPYIRVAPANNPDVTYSGMVWFDTAIELQSESGDPTIASKLRSDIGDLLDYDTEIQT